MSNPHDRLKSVDASTVDPSTKLRELQRQDLALLLENQAFRRFVHRLLSKAGVMNSVYAQNAQIYALAARQDLGHEVFTWLLEANEEVAFECLKTRKYGESTYV